MDTLKISFRKLIRDPLARNSAIVLMGTMVANVLSYIYHMVMGRMLGPSGYGELSSLLSLVYIFTVPLTVAQTVLVKFISGFKAHGEIGQSKTLFVKSMRLFVIVSIVGVPIVLIGSPYISSFLHLPSTALMLLLYGLLVFSLLIVPTASALTGYQKFVWVSAMGAIGVCMKLFMSIPLVAWGVPGVMFAALLASIIVYVVYFIPLKFILSVRTEPTNVKHRDMLKFAIPTLLTLFGITSLYSTDIILVRHFFSAQDAGLYAALAILGKIIFYASSAIAVVLFPVASERTALGANTKKIILTAIAVVAAISAGITILYFLFPQLIVSLLFGNSYVKAGAMLGRFGIFLGLFSIGNILATASLAVGKTKIWLFAVLAALIQIVGISMVHTSIQVVIMIDIGVCLLYDIMACVYYLWESA